MDKLNLSVMLFICTLKGLHCPPPSCYYNTELTKYVSSITRDMVSQQIQGDLLDG